MGIVGSMNGTVAARWADCSFEPARPVADADVEMTPRIGSRRPPSMAAAAI